MNNDVILSIRDLTWKANGKSILNIPAFEIKRGEVISLIGPNGAGKSSLLKILGLLQRSDSGELFFEGKPVHGNLLAFRRRMSMVFQDPLLLSGTVYSNVAQGLRFRGVKRNELDERVRYWLDRFRISHLINRSYKNLSGGEAQRVSLARALAVEPEILYLDEPFAALDQPTRYALAEEMGEIIRSRGISAVFVTHNAEELSIFTDRICVMNRGSIVQEGRPEEVFNKPVNEVVAGLVGVENILEGIAGDQNNTALIQDIPVEVNMTDVHPGTHVKLFIRPENILQGNESSRNNFHGTIEKAISLSSQYKLIVNCGFHLTVLLSKGLYTYEQVKPGSEIDISISPDKIHIVQSDI